MTKTDSAEFIGVLYKRVLLHTYTHNTVVYTSRLEEIPEEQLKSLVLTLSTYIIIIYIYTTTIY